MLDADRLQADSPYRLMDRAARRLVLDSLQRFPVGQLTITEPDGNRVVMGEVRQRRSCICLIGAPTA